jgi:hypothetical protein
MRRPASTHIIALTDPEGMSWAMVPWPTPGAELRLYLPSVVVDHEANGVVPAPSVTLAWGPRAKAFTRGEEVGTDGTMMRVPASSPALVYGIPIPMNPSPIGTGTLYLGLWNYVGNPILTVPMPPAILYRLPFEDSP